MNLRKLLLRPFAATNADAGMTLIEIIIVMALIGGLMTFIVGAIMQGADNARAKSAEIGMNQLRSSLQMYKLNSTRFPTTEQGLKALLEKPDGAKGWRGPYCEPELLRDPWGGEITYESDGKQIKLVSAGKDEQVGTEDDIIWPEPKEEGVPTH